MNKLLKISLLGFVLLFSTFVSATPKIENWTTDSGLRIYYVHVPELPMLDARLTFAAGSAYDKDKAGISGMVTSMLDKGGDPLSYSSFTSHVGEYY